MQEKLENNIARSHVFSPEQLFTPTFSYISDHITKVFPRKIKSGSCLYYFIPKYTETLFVRNRGNKFLQVTKLTYQQTNY